MGDLNQAVFINLKIIDHPKGSIYRALRKDEEQFSGFGEAYFSKVFFDQIKGWKRHTRFTLNLTVPVGRVQVVLAEFEKGSIPRFKEFILGEDNYGRLTVPPGLWMAFRGLSEGQNLLMNVMNEIHDPNEAEALDLTLMDYIWQPAKSV